MSNTPTEELIKSTYVGIQRRWNRGRFMRLAGMLSLNRREMGALIGLCPRALAAAEKKNEFSVPACLHLQNIENFVMVAGLHLQPEHPTALEMLRLKPIDEENKEEHAINHKAVFIA